MLCSYIPAGGQAVNTAVTESCSAWQFTDKVAVLASTGSESSFIAVLQGQVHSHPRARYSFACRTMLCIEPIAASTPATPYTLIIVMLNQSSTPLGFLACTDISRSSAAQFRPLQRLHETDQAKVMLPSFLNACLLALKMAMCAMLWDI